MKETYTPAMWADLDAVKWADFEDSLLRHLRENVQDGDDLEARTHLDDNGVELAEAETNYSRLNGVNTPHVMACVFRKDGKLLAVRPSDIFRIEDGAMDEAAAVLDSDPDAFAVRYIREPDWSRAVSLEDLNLALPDEDIQM